MTFFAKAKAFIKREVDMLTTKLGLVLTAVSTVAPQYAAVNQKIAIAGFVAGMVLIVWRERSKNDAGR